MKKLDSSVETVALALVDVLFQMDEIDLDTYRRVNTMYRASVKAVD